VQANYAAEPTLGTLSGPSVSRFIQEAFLGYRLRDGLWVDAGVFFAPFGAESWISRDNPVYTRSLIADNSPYYESGVRLSWQARPTLQVQAHVINGWQNISETNEDKAVAVRADWTAARTLVLTYDAFVGNEQPDSARSRVRQFHEAIARWAPNGRTTLWATFDYGRQPRARAGAGAASWRGFAVLAHRTLTSRVGVGGRAEGYWDLEQTIVTTPALRPFGAGGGSVNVDVALHPRALWRTELRALSASEWIFPTRRPRGYTDRDGVLVSSLALTF
jgi:hypothetical protein